MSILSIVIYSILAIITAAVIYFGFKLYRNWDQYSKMLQMYQKMNTGKKTEKPRFSHGTGNKQANRKKKKKK